MTYFLTLCAVLNIIDARCNLKPKLLLTTKTAEIQSPKILII